MARYHCAFSHGSVSTSFKTAGHPRAPASGMRRLKLSDWFLGAGGTPADNALEWSFDRTTANGTDGSTVTPVPLDPADAAAVFTFGQGVTAEPTVTASTTLWHLYKNQRASYRAFLAPGNELVVPATANAGMALRVLSASYTGAAGGGIYIDEQ